MIKFIYVMIFGQMDTAAEDLIRKRKRAKAEAFKRVAERRTERVLQSLRLLGQCSNRRSYQDTDEQITKVFREIRSAVRHAEQRFRNYGRNTSFEL
jgi:chorismate mutase